MNKIKLLPLLLLPFCAIALANGFEPIRSAFVTYNAITLKVQSSGCTTAKNFSIEKNYDKEDLLHITFVRIKPDLCKMMPHITTITLKKTDFGINEKRPVYINNSFRAFEQLPDMSDRRKPEPTPKDKPSEE